MNSSSFLHIPRAVRHALVISVTMICLAPAGLMCQEMRPAFQSRRFLTGVLVSQSAFWLGNAVQSAAGPDRAHWTTPPRIDRYFRDQFYTGNSTNWLDDNGVYYTLIGGAVIAAAAPAALTGDFDGESALYDLLAFGSGAAFAGGTTRIIKGLVSRPRPSVYYGTPGGSGDMEDRDNYRSFVSGHASTAFFTADFLDARLGRLFDRHAPRLQRRGYRFARAALLYGWAINMAYSRLAIDRHYFTDVLAGALLGVFTGRLAVRWFYPQKSARPARGLAQITATENRVFVSIVW